MRVNVNTRNPEKPLFTTRSLLIIALVVLAVTGGNLWLNRNAPPLGYVEYSQRGFTIYHPRDMQIYVEGLGQPRPTSDLGVLIGKRETTSLEQFGVIWLSTEMASDLDEALDLILSAAQEDNAEVTELGERETSTVNSHEMRVSKFTITEPGVHARGAVGVWYCDGDDRYLMLYLLHVPDLSQLDVLSKSVDRMWRGYVKSFECH